jgi:hypothetical protein
MPLINLTVKHQRSFAEARNALETAVDQVQRQFSVLVREVKWSADRNQVRINGTGFWAEMWVDAREVHVTADIPLLGGLLGGAMETELKQIVQQTFQKKLT